MPVYNGARYLRHALDSLVEQQSREFEVVIVDNGSTDETSSIIREYAATLPLRAFSQPHADSWLRGTNAALREARGEFVAVLHDDDWWHPTRYAELTALSARFPTADWLATPVQFVDATDRVLGNWTAPLRAGLHPPDSITAALLIQNFFAVVGPAVRRRALLDADGLNESLWYTADWDCWLRLSTRCALAYATTPTASYRVHANSQTSQRSRAPNALRMQLLAAYEPHAQRFLANHPAFAEIDAVARFSIDVNSALAALAQGAKEEALTLPWRFVRLGPSGWRRYFRDSRIVERVGARLRLPR